jgi:hypothetical protein
VLLSDNLGEFLRTVFARQDGVAHEPEETIIRDERNDGAAGPKGAVEYGPPEIRKLLRSREIALTQLV